MIGRKNSLAVSAGTVTRRPESATPRYVASQSGRAPQVDADIGQAERHGASREALVQSDFAVRCPGDRGLNLVVRDEASNILRDDDRRRHRRRCKITQYSPLLVVAGTLRSVPILNKSRRMCAFRGGSKFYQGSEFAGEYSATLAARIMTRCAGVCSRMA